MFFDWMTILLYVLSDLNESFSYKFKLFISNEVELFQITAFYSIMYFFFLSQINRQNNLGQTALFYTILREDMRSARLLLEAGACPSLQACVWKSRRKKRLVNSLNLLLLLSIGEKKIFSYWINHFLLCQRILMFTLIA